MGRSIHLLQRIQRKGAASIHWSIRTPLDRSIACFIDRIIAPNDWVDFRSRSGFNSQYRSSGPPNFARKTRHATRPPRPEPTPIDRYPRCYTRAGLLFPLFVRLAERRVPAAGSTALWKHQTDPRRPPNQRSRPPLPTRSQPSPRALLPFLSSRTARSPRQTDDGGANQRRRVSCLNRSRPARPHGSI